MIDPTSALAVDGPAILQAVLPPVSTPTWVESTSGGVFPVRALHMLARADVGVGERVAPGQRLGVVGESGRATACDVHFELWTAPGWVCGRSSRRPPPRIDELEGCRRGAYRVKRAAQPVQR